MLSNMRNYFQEINGISGGWYPIENDSRVFTQLIKKIGVNGVQVEELWCVKDHIFDNLRPVHGIILLLKDISNEQPSTLMTTASNLTSIYFASQIITNACATQAIVNVLLNCNHPDVDIGPELTKFKEETMLYDPKMRGLALSNSNVIRNAHNSLSKKSTLYGTSLSMKKNRAAYHFIVFVPISGRVYEMDSLQMEPIDHGQIMPDQEWVSVVQSNIMKKVTSYVQGDISFHMMTLITDKKVIYQRRIHEIQTRAELYETQADEVQYEVPSLRVLIQYEEVKMAKYQHEILRRRHNYTPFILNFIKALGKKKISRLLEKAKRRANKRISKKGRV